MNQKLLSMAFFLFLLSIVFSCSSSAGDDWYEISLSFDESTFPEGVVLQEQSIVNTNSEPLYIVSECEYCDDYSEFGVPPKYSPEVKLMGGELYRLIRNSSGNINWAKPVFDSGGYTVPARKVASNYKFGDNRPENVKIPEPEEFSIQIYYLGEVAELKGHVAYALNSYYDSKANAKGIEACNSLNFINGVILPILALFAIVFVIGLIVFWKVKSKA